jgi:Leucine-rich repeat (LRR) protein
MKIRRHRTVAGKVASVAIAAMCAITLLFASNGMNALAQTAGAQTGISVPVSNMVLKTAPKDVTAAVGDTVSFETLVTQTTGTVSYQWQTKAPGSSEWKNSASSNGTKRIFSLKVQAGHNGYQFRCIVKDGGSTSITTPAATLTVLSDTLTITAQPKDASVAIGSTAEFTVAAVGKATLKYQWQTKAPGSLSWKNSTASSATKATFTIGVQEAHNGYEVRCIVTDGNNKKVTSNTAMLTVKPVILCTTPSMKVVPGSEVNFMVAARGIGTLKYQWQTKAPGSSTWQNSTNATAKKDMFQLRAAKAGHDGYQFRCVVTDGNGKKAVSSPIKLTLGSCLINKDTFPDAKFRAYVKGYDTDGDDSLSWNELFSLSSLQVEDQGITDLTGMEYFTHLISIQAAGNQLKKIDTTKNALLEIIYISSNSLTSLDLSRNPNLMIVECQKNQLTSLNLGISPSLYSLDCSVNRLTKLDLSTKKYMGYLNCCWNKLAKLDLSKNNYLGNIYCSDNLLTTLKLGGGSELYNLFCEDNQLTSIDVSKYGNLECLSCYNNRITKLDVGKNAELELLMCTYNEFTTIDITKNAKLKELYVSEGTTIKMTAAQEASVIVHYD